MAFTTHITIRPPYRPKMPNKYPIRVAMGLNDRPPSVKAEPAVNIRAIGADTIPSAQDMRAHGTV